MLLAELMRVLNDRERDIFAKRADTTTAYLYQLAGRHSFASPKKAVQLEQSAKSMGYDIDRRDLVKNGIEIWPESA